MLCNSEKGGAYFFMEIVKTKKTALVQLFIDLDWTMVVY